MAKPEQITMGEFLSRWYTQQTTYADVARKKHNGVEVDYVVREYHCNPSKKPALRGEIRKEGDTVSNSFIIDETTPHHTEGHLLGMPILPGHLADGAIIEAARFGADDLWLVSFRTIAHSEPGLPGDRLVATATILEDESGVRLVKGRVECKNRVHTRAFAMRLDRGPHLPSDMLYLSQHQLFEIAAQAAGGAIRLLHPEIFDTEEEKVPIFDSIGPSTLEKVTLRPEQVLKSNVTLRRLSGQGAFYLDVAMRRDNQQIATFTNLGIGFLPREQILAKIDQLKQT